MVPSSHFAENRYRRDCNGMVSYRSWGRLSHRHQERPGCQRAPVHSIPGLRIRRAAPQTRRQNEQLGFWMFLICAMICHGENVCEMILNCCVMPICRIVNIHQWFKMIPIPTVRIPVRMDDHTTSIPCSINFMAAKFRGRQCSTQHLGESSCSSKTAKDTTRPNWENLPGKRSTRSSSATGHKFVPARMEPGICNVVTLWN